MATPGNGTAPVIDPAPLGLTQSDLPQGFTLVESRTKTPSEMPRLALDLGWQGGYMAQYTGPVPEGTGTYDIMHSIAIYPSGKIPDVIDYSVQQGQSDSDFAYSVIPVPGPGAQSRAFSGRIREQIPGNAGMTGNTGNTGSLVTSMENPDGRTSLKTNFSMIIFSRGNTFEVIKLSGTDPDTDFLVNLSQKAYAKIP
ncbi:MAG: hypothetical protein CVV30_05590 [Methanomicrobiales archaeon HGW-Methanomicrobiales-1]|jgi:hypothetical protein|nr:MAG: hypothetical protein CVV30_05590 [Methanomicrobiales archaeon HGW-Methanomicrobiales-1]